MESLERYMTVASSLLYSIGILLSSAGVYAPLFCGDHKEDRQLVSHICVVGWSIVSLSLVPELVIDCTCKRRSLARGRYNNNKTTTILFIIINWLVSITFLIGAMLQGIAWKRYWEEDYGHNGDNDNTEGEGTLPTTLQMVAPNQLILCGGIAWTLTGLLAFCSSKKFPCHNTNGLSSAACDDQQRRHGRSPQRQQRQQDDLVDVLTYIGNGIFLGSSVTLIFGSFDSCDNCFLGFFLWMGAYLGFVLCGILWLFPRDVDEECSTTSSASSSSSSSSNTSANFSSRPRVAKAAPTSNSTTSSTSPSKKKKTASIITDKNKPNHNHHHHRDDSNTEEWIDEEYDYEEEIIIEEKEIIIGPIDIEEHDHHNQQEEDDDDEIKIGPLVDYVQNEEEEEEIVIGGADHHHHHHHSTCCHDDLEMMTNGDKVPPPPPTVLRKCTSLPIYHHNNNNNNNNNTSHYFW